MKLHTDTLTERDVHVALDDLPNVYAEVKAQGSRSRDHALDVYLTGNSPHRPNRNYDGDVYAATWDEWGIMLARLFYLDPSMTCRQYANAEDFHWQTGYRFRHLMPSEMHRAHKWEFHGMPGENYCECGAVKRWHVGQRTNISA